MNDELLTVDEAAAYLKVTSAAVYLWIKEKALPTVRAGSLIRIRKAELDEWTERERVA